ncbi:hypothetical protein MTR_2g079350 [Medicago truncatula]|uniref:Uncharacterized protein n=1 Tax=Medicago truncatula TaxID=3880 RepID=A0A072VBC5_MEDTR|nr:hypothetical protein MTR_2g079350 [Medicago truncatula]
MSTNFMKLFKPNLKHKGVKKTYFGALSTKNAFTSTGSMKVGASRPSSSAMHHLIIFEFRHVCPSRETPRRFVPNIIEGGLPRIVYGLFL